MDAESMREEKKGSREEEEKYLCRTLSIVDANVENYGREVGRMQEDIDEMLAQIGRASCRERV